MADDGSGPWVRLLKIAVFASISIMLGWTAVNSVPAMLGSLRESRCKRNLVQISSAIALYRNENGNQFPLYLAALYPKYLNVKDVFLCPMDRDDRVVGAQPEWMKLHDTGHEDDLHPHYRSADLDGPTGDVEEDQDTFPCSYLYALSNYEEEAFGGARWRELFYATQKQTSGLQLAEMPIVRCLHHLKAKPPPSFDDLGDRIPQKFDKSYDTPTYNILYDLRYVELPADWLKR